MAPMVENGWKLRVWQPWKLPLIGDVGLGNGGPTGGGPQPPGWVGVGSWGRFCRAGFPERLDLAGDNAWLRQGLRGAARRRPEEVEELAMTGPALADIAGTDPAAEEHGEEEHGADDDCGCPSGK